MCPSILAFAPAAWAETIVFPNPQAPNPGTTYTWTVPAGVSSVTVECRGGGGAGGAAVSETIASTSNFNIRGGGGAGGNYAKKVNLAVSVGEQYEVTVGTGGISPADGAYVQGNQLPEQTGGSSSFKKVGNPVAAALATGGIGGKNGVRLAPTNSGPNQGGGAPSLANTCIGDTIILGGSGGGASASGTGSGAGDVSAGGSGGAGATPGAAGSTGGGAGAPGTTGLSPTSSPTGNGTTGAAPGGGGSGSGRNTFIANSPGNIFKVPGGAGGAGTVTLSFAFQTGVTKYAVTGTSPQQVTDGLLGSGFDITITAQDDNGATVADSTNIVTMSSPTLGSLLEFDWDSNGTYGDNSGTLNANGVKTIKARNKRAQTVDIVASTGAVTTPVPFSLTTTARPYASLQILVPGEAAAPGTATGKTGAPTARTVGAGFSIFVNAVDMFFNRIETNEDEISISSSEPVLTPWPTGELLTAGTIELLLPAFTTPGPQTLTATNLDINRPGSVVSPSITVNPIPATWVGNTL